MTPNSFPKYDRVEGFKNCFKELQSLSLCVLFKEYLNVIKLDKKLGKLEKIICYTLLENSAPRELTFQFPSFKRRFMILCKIQGSYL